MNKSLALFLFASACFASPAWAQSPASKEQDAFATRVKSDWGWQPESRVRVVVPRADMDARELERLGLAKLKGLSDRPWVAFVTSDYTVLVRSVPEGEGVLIIDRKSKKIISKAASSKTSKVTARFRPRITPSR